MDLYNRESVSYSVSLHPDLQEIRDMLDGLFAKLPKTATPIFIQTRAGSISTLNISACVGRKQYQTKHVAKWKIMDNGAVENFFGRLKVKMFYGEHFETVDEFFNCLKKYIYYYNDEIFVSKLKMSPIKFQTHSFQS